MRREGEGDDDDNIYIYIYIYYFQGFHARRIDHFDVANAFPSHACGQHYFSHISFA
jgi:hypothetical protein